MISPFLVTPLPLPHSNSLLPTPFCLYEGAPTNSPFLPYHTISPLCWIIKYLQDQVSPLTLMADKAIFCYIWMWSHGFLHVYSLAGGLVPGSSVWSSQPTLFFFFFFIGFNSLLWLFLKCESTKPCRNESAQTKHTLNMKKSSGWDHDFTSTSSLHYGSQVIPHFSWSEPPKANLIADPNFYVIFCHLPFQAFL